MNSCLPTWLAIAARFATLRVPTLYLRATEDRAVPAAVSREVHRLKPDTQVVELQGPHFLLQVTPAEAAQAIQTFVRSADNATRSP